MRGPRNPKYTHEYWAEKVGLKKLDEDWHLRYNPTDVNRRRRFKRYILAHFHNTISYITRDMHCVMCGQLPPESIQMVLKLQCLKGKI